MNKESNVVLNFKMDGQIEYAKTIRDINAIMNAAAAEYRTHIAAMGQDAEATKKLAAEKKKLEIQLEAGRERTQRLRNEYEALAKNTNTSTGQLANKYRQLQNSERAEIALEQALDRVNSELSEQAEASRQAEEALNKLESESEKLESRSEKLNAEYELQKSQLGDNATETEKLALKMEHLNKSHEVAGEKVKNYEQQLEQTKIQYGENSTEVDKYETQLLEARTAEQQLANEIFETNQKLKEQENVLKMTSDILEKTGNKMSSLGKTATTHVTAPIVGIGAATFTATKQVGDAMGIIINKTGATGDRVDDLRKSFDNVFKNVPDSADEVANVLANLHQTTDATGEELEKLTEQTLKYARVNNEDATESADRLGVLMNALEVEISEMPFVMDKLTKATQETGIGVNDLINHVIDAGPAFEEMGFDLDRSIALFSNFHKAGAEPREVLSSLNIVLNRMAKDGATNAEDAFNMLMDKIKAAPDILSATTIASEAFGAKVGAKVAEDIRAGAFEVDEFVAVLEQAEGALDETAKESEGFSEKLGEFRNKVTLAAEPIGSSLIDSLERLLDVALPVVNVIVSIAQWFSKIPTPIQTLIVAIVALIAAIGPLLVITGSLVSSFGTVVGAIGPAIGLVSKFGGAFGAVSKAVGPIMALLPKLGSMFAFLANPIGIAVVAIGAIVTALIWAYNNVEWFRDAVHDCWELIKEVTVAVFEWLANFFVGLWESVKEIFAKATELLSGLISDSWDWIKDTTVKVFNSVVDFFKKWGSTILKVLTNPIGMLVSLIIKNWDKIKDFTSRIWETIKNSIINPIKTARDNVVKFITNLYTNARDNFNKLKTSATNIFEATRKAMIRPIELARDKIKEIIDTIKNFFKNLKLKLPKIELPKLPRFKLDGEFSLNPPSVPKLGVDWHAKGGIFTQPTIFGVSNGRLQGAGEAGPEAVLPLNDKTLGDIGKGIVEAMEKGRTNDINVTVDLDGETIARKTIKYTSRELYTLQQRKNRGGGGR